MTTNNEAFEKFFPRPFKFSDKAHELETMSKWNDAKITWESSLQSATTEANKRMAELDSEVAELKESNSLLVSMNISLAKENSELQVQLQNWKDFSKKVQKIDFNDYLQLQASNNHLREAFNGYHLAIKQRALTVDIEQKLLNLLKATPAESLQAFENEVIEKCAKVCDHVNNQYADIFKETKDTFNDGASYGADDCAEVIRALKEVK
jgi:regulator of replication initiation timing